MMKQWRSVKKERLPRRRNWASLTQPCTSYDQEEAHKFSLPRSVKIKRATVHSLHHDFEAQSVVMARAKEVQEKLSLNYPSFVKVMLPSHVTGGFWLGLPKGFCDNHLPKQDTTIFLQDESGIEYPTKFMFERTGLSAGWRGFAIVHKLLQGDVLVFHLVLHNKFMVYVVRCNVVAEIDGAVGLEFEACNKNTPLYSEEYIPHIKEEQMTIDDENGKQTSIDPVKEEENHNPVSLATHYRKEHKQTSSHVHFETEMLPVLEESENGRSFDSNYMNGIRLSDSTPDFDKVKRLNDISFSVNGLSMGSEFSSHIKTKCYENGKETNIAPVKEEEKDDPVSLASHIPKGQDQTSSHVHLDTEMLPVLEESENARSFSSNSMNGIGLSGSTLDFNKAKSLNDFGISGNGLIMDSEFSSHIRTNYYEHSKKTNTVPVKVEKNDKPVSLATDIHEEQEQESIHVHLDTAKSKTDGKSFGSGSNSANLDFNRVESTNDFGISANGLIMDSEFSSHIRTNYYEHSIKTNTVSVKVEKNGKPVSLATDIQEEHEQESILVHLDTEKSKTDGKSFDSGSNSMNGIRLPGAILDFNKVKSSIDFSISASGLIIDSEFSSEVRTKYYELCCSQNTFLHDHILEGLNHKLVSEVISETINIADAIKTCNISTSQEQLTTWDKTLIAFEGLGMNVGFLRARICQLSMLSLKPEKKRETEVKRESTKQEICILMANIMDARARIKQLEAEIHNLDADMENMEKLFREVASAPW